MMGDGKEKWQDELCAYGSTCLDGSVTGGPLGNEVAVVASFSRHTSSLQTVYDGLYVAAYRGSGCICEVWPQGEVQFPAAYLEQTLYPFHGSLLLLLILSPSNFKQGLPAVGVLLYGSVVTPLYEELLFRGYLWNRLSDVGYSPRRLILCTALLFAVWHVGYMANAIAEGNWFAVISKVMVGLCYGFLLGWVRVKTGNCYSTCLVHGLMNLLSV